MRTALPLIAVAVLLAGCGREVRMPGPEVDGAPDDQLDPALIETPQPRPEPPSAYGNHSPYEVFGQTYHVRSTAEGYAERGIASWYGTKFHGRPTSSGEPYDMYRMTAAHRSLPLPTWAEVTRLDTGKTIIVRINDRGPFHPDRIIDLSWAAAVKLDMVDKGTAPVKVRAITFDEDQGVTPRPARVPVFVQVGAFSDQDRARGMAERLENAGLGPIHTETARNAGGPIWRVRVGPIDQVERARSLIERVTELGFGPAQYVYP
ncbi:septal ring lytic transglycosylase RlpA family protein [Wenzhouxiangella sp. AB-CW3]|uniref:septal ring lytic transglycosylase RlpA family protein n=1 Tax=Wenzhouxiangella sp. AB-CW3 TaxID=2771012 RepID=UPI00168A7DFC|nr:septal ring lytic transglycosylase RlpA family protein [Wenzhouxiangella sp. AB-CW3]QOC24125.1 septal ring lytic transglycosylase RlpA family protein [Wenzhouxiangella sp. AB-CW3]